VSGYTGETMSFSSINSFAGYGGCQMAWALDRIYKCPPDKPKGQQLVLGTAFDAGVKTAHDATLSGERPTPDVAIGAAIDAWNEEMDTGKYATDQWSGLPGLLPSAVRQYVTEVAPTIRPIATQHPVRIKFDEVDWELVAKIDLLAESDLAPGLEDIIDAKATASSSTKYLAENDLQLDLYAIARSFEGGKVGRTGFHAARILKTKAEIVTDYAEVTQDGLDRALDLLGDIASSIEEACEQDRFLPTARLARTWKCSEKFCDFYPRTCAYGARNRTSVAIPEVA
jgi:hypothetical protein